MARTSRRSTLIFLAVLAITGCGARGGPTLPEGVAVGLAPDQPQDVRALLEHQHRQRYLAERRRCLARGGRMVIQAGQTLGRGAIPQRSDRYMCG